MILIFLKDTFVFVWNVPFLFWHGTIFGRVPFCASCSLSSSKKTQFYEIELLYFQRSNIKSRWSHLFDDYARAMYALKCRLLNFFSDCEKNTHKHKKEEKIYSSCQFSAVTKAQNRAPFGWFEWLIFDWSAKRIVFLSSSFYSLATLLLYTVFWSNAWLTRRLPYVSRLFSWTFHIVRQKGVALLSV